MFKSIAIVFN